MLRLLRRQPTAKRPLRVLHCPTTVGGNPQGLSRHLRQLGVESTSLTLLQNVYAYPADQVVWSPGDGLLARELKRLLAIARAARGFDVIHFNFGTTLADPLPATQPVAGVLKRPLRALRARYANALQRVELEVYRALGKRMFVHYQGDDARQGDYCVAHFEHTTATRVPPGYYSPESDAFKRRSIRRMARFCEQIYALNPDLLHVLPEGSKFLPYSHLALDEWTPVWNQGEARPLRIAHAPTHRAFKGTARVLAAREELRAEGYDFELILVEGISNAEAKRRYATADVLVDQLYAGWYGGVALEAMALGKPVLCYLRQDDLRFIPEAMRAELPVLSVSERTIKQGLRQVLDMPREELLGWARRSRAFVERWHDPLKIAAQVKADYERSLNHP